MDALIQKSAEVPVPVVETKKREVHAYVSIFGNRDSVGDIVHPGAFVKSLGRVSKGLVPVKHNHDRIVGKMLEAHEDSKGLFTVQKFSRDPESDRIFGMVEDGTIPTFSFKARIPTGGQVRRKGEDGQVTNHLTEMHLLEAGPADPDLAVNDQTFVVATKAGGELLDLASIFGTEEWIAKAIEMMSADEKAAIREILNTQHNEAESIAKAVRGALQLDEAIEEWRIGNLIRRIEGINLRGLGTAN